MNRILELALGIPEERRPWAGGLVRGILTLSIENNFVDSVRENPALSRGRLSTGSVP